ncbi:BON domain-containing protein [Halopseudomonas sabulinigri]|uniref:BON domain-containing protein n=1 Tax=Halopseudomonas sabulinigri TaxID=472181 RepID=A0ABP9ZPX9_9GAMM
MHGINRTALLALSISFTALLPLTAHAADRDSRTMPTEQREGKGQPLDDDRILTATLQSRLQWDGNTDGIQIRVNAHDGMVTLSGTVLHVNDKRVAIATARNTPGVRALDASELKVGRAAPQLTEPRWASTDSVTDRGPTLRL